MSVKEYKVPFYIKINRFFLRYGLWTIFNMLGRVKVIGKENIPFGKSYVIAMNHISIFDPPLVGSFWPEEPEIIGASDVFQKKGQGQSFRFMELYRFIAGTMTGSCSIKF